MTNSIPLYRDDYSVPASPEPEESINLQSHQDLIRYVISGFVLGTYKSWKEESDPTLKSLLNCIDELKEKHSEELKRKEMQLREKLLEQYVNQFDMEERFAPYQAYYMHDVECRALHFMMGSSIDGFEATNDSLDMCPEFIQQFIALAGTTLLDLRNYMFGVRTVLVKVFAIFVKKLKAGTISLDARYRRPFQDSLYKTIDHICQNDLDDEFFQDSFPVKEEQQNSVQYPLRGDYVYEWSRADEYNMPDHITFKGPFANVKLESHQLAALPVLYTSVHAEFSKNHRNNLNQEDIIAMLICYGVYGRGRVREMFSLPDGVYYSLMASAEADLNHICELACGL